MRKFIFLLSLAAISSLTLLGDTLSDVVTQRAETNLNENKRAAFLSPGRKSILLEMERYPGQLSSDIKRVPIIIGGNPISDTLRETKTPNELFLIVAGNLEKYLSQKSPKIVNAGVKGRMGQFWTSEVVYPVIQNFSSTGQAKAYEEVPALKLREWGGKAGDAKFNASYTISPEGILELTDRTEKNMLNLEDNNKKAPFISETKMRFDLNKGTVTFEYSYSFLGKSKKWTSEVFEFPN